MAQEAISFLEIIISSANLLLSLALLVFIVNIARIFTTGVFSKFFRILRIGFVFLLLDNIFARLSAAKLLPGPPSPYSLLAVDDLFHTVFIILQSFGFLVLYRQWRRIHLAEVSKGATG